MLSSFQFSSLVIEKTLKAMGKYSEAAHILLLGTAITESGLRYLKQLNNGPAKGLYQMEPATANDIWDNYLEYRDGLASVVDEFMVSGINRIDQLEGNMYYATAMARVHYLRVPAALPNPRDAEAMADYHKVYYNTYEGKTNPQVSVDHFKLAIDLVMGPL